MEGKAPATSSARGLRWVAAVIVSVMMAAPAGAGFVGTQVLDDATAAIDLTPRPDVTALRAAHVEALASIVHEDDTARRAAVAELGTRHQAEVMGLTLGAVPAPVHATPGEALRAWLGVIGVDVTPSIEADMAFLDSINPTHATALAALIDAHSAIEQAVRADDRAGVLAARIALIHAVAQATVAWEEGPATNQITCTPISSPGAYYHDVGSCNNPLGGSCHTTDYQMMFDAGGDDSYCNNAGGSAHDKTPYFSASLTDLDGDDIYAGGDYGRTRGINGGARGGSNGFLWDGGGNDFYRAGKMYGGQQSSVNGGATTAATAALYDVSGDDRYEGGWDAAQGGGDGKGSGTLVDYAGNDVYTGIKGGQPFGAVHGGAMGGGFGYLYDESGDDSYYAGSVGTNGGAHGCGSGFLLDAGGNDWYYGRYAGANGGGVGGWGYLRDEAGDDEYTTLGAAGAGQQGTCPGSSVTVQGSGLLQDDSGCDYYEDGWPGATGYDVSMIKGTGAQYDAPVLGCGVAEGIFSGSYFSCILLKVGDVECWGRNYQGDSAGRAQQDVLAAGAGAAHTCYVLKTNDVECVGWDGYGQASPPAGLKAIAVSGGDYHSCAITTNNNVVCWGDNGYGQADPYNGGNAVQLDANEERTCFVLSTGAAKCNGYDYKGSGQDYAGTDAVKVGVGLTSNCVLTTTGTVNCWGSQWPGTWGYSGAVPAVDVALGYNHGCALLSNGNVKCWGWDGWDQVQDYNKGDGVAITAGSSHTCVLTTADEVTCWGSNIHGESNGWTP